MSLPIKTITNQSLSSTPKSRTKPLLIGLSIVLVLSIIAIFALNFFNKNTTTISPIETKGTNNITKGIADNNTKNKKTDEELAKLSSAIKEKESLTKSKNPGDPTDKTKSFNILVLGIDRRYGNQKNWRTDVIQLVTISKNRDKVLITHIPRDVWAGSYKINALYNLQGPKAMKDKVEEITGQRPDRIIRFDFDAFVWAIDSIGGITIDVDKPFEDTSYPDDRNGTQETKTISFKAGEQIMDGETALIYARSRKGTNGEGSDYARGTRQQKIMQSIVKDFFNKDNLFKPKTAETVYKLATQKVYTDFTLTDTKVLFDVVKNYKNIEVLKLSLDTNNYLIVPTNRDDYGGAWTLVAKNGNFAPIHNEINNLIQ